jgi:hypothetical protein
MTSVISNAVFKQSGSIDQIGENGACAKAFRIKRAI